MIIIDWNSHKFYLILNSFLDESLYSLTYNWIIDMRAAGSLSLPFPSMNKNLIQFYTMKELLMKFIWLQSQYKMCNNFCVIYSNISLQLTNMLR